MEITYVVVTYIITYTLGAITKTFIDAIPNKFIPLQNVIIGVVSGIICYYLGLEESIIQAIVLCFMSALSAGGTADLKGMKKQ